MGEQGGLAVEEFACSPQPCTRRVHIGCSTCALPAGVAVLAAALGAARLDGALGAVVPLALVLVVLRQQEEGVPQTDRCKLHTGHRDGRRLTLAKTRRIMGNQLSHLFMYTDGALRTLIRKIIDTFSMFVSMAVMRPLVVCMCPFLHVVRRDSTQTHSEWCVCAHL